MNLTIEQIERLSQVSGLRKRVTQQTKDRSQKFVVGVTDDVVGVFMDRENKYEVQRIRCVPELEQEHGSHVYRVTYYTYRADGRLCMGAQYAPILDQPEISSLFDQVRAKNWF